MAKCLHLILPTKGSVLIVNKTSASELLGKGALIMETLKTISNLYDVIMNNNKSEVTLYAMSNIMYSSALAMVIHRVTALVDKGTPPITKGLVRLGAYASVPSFRKHFLEPFSRQLFSRKSRPVS